MIPDLDAEANKFDQILCRLLSALFKLPRAAGIQTSMPIMRP